MRADPRVRGRYRSLFTLRRFALRNTVLVLALGIWFAIAGAPSWAAGEGEESCFTSSLNAERAAAGRAPLATRNDLVDLARKHSGRMANDNEIYHNQNLQGEAPADWKSIGENVGRGPACAPIHDAFMKSPAHRKNILDPDFTLIGIGVVLRGDTIFVTEVFMVPTAPAPPPPPPPPASPAPVESPAASPASTDAPEPSPSASVATPTTTASATPTATNPKEAGGGTGGALLIAVGVGAAALLVFVYTRGRKRTRGPGGRGAEV